MTDVLVDSDRGGRLSTQPEPPSLRPSGRGPIPVLRLLWRRLTSMRTALLLLALLAIAAIPGTVIPQTSLDPVKVDSFVTNHPHLGPLFHRLSLFNVFGAPWFAAIYLLLFVSLIGCVIPRLRLHARAMLRRPPDAPRHLNRLPASADWVVDDEAPDDVAARARAELRRRRWRADIRTEADGAVTVAAETGYLRETGNLVFHLALLLLLAGIALGGLFGYKGTVLVTVGPQGGFSNAQSQYDVFSPARLFSDSSLSPFSLTLKKFTASYQADGEPTTFQAAVTYKTDPTAASRPYDIQVNHPLNIGGAKVFLVGHGYSMHLRLTNKAGRTVYDTNTPFLPDNSQFYSHGVVKVPDLAPKQQLGILGFFYPTYGVTTSGTAVSSYPGLKNPVLSLVAFTGDLGVNSGAPQSVYSLPITSKMTNIGTKQLRPGSSWKLKDGATLHFEGINQWATLQVAHEPGKTTVLIAAILIVAGLIGSLFVRRRRFWLRAVPVPASDGSTSRRTVVTAAGLGRNDAEGFAAELRDLVARLGRTEAEGSAVSDHTEEG
ncbi:MAG TPA: cytochrome c biogenesis protein ResB [Mycobacteriales bacterium]|jgi:cytochrome c biogenesis protein|nr:cytochrome c biogenesis protein ResB [Mycobacteriales bacterium]